MKHTLDASERLTYHLRVVYRGKELKNITNHPLRSILRVQEHRDGKINLHDEISSRGIMKIIFYCI